VLVLVAEEAAVARTWHALLDSVGVYLTAPALFADAF
jgi:hypothetical protein